MTEVIRGFKEKTIVKTIKRKIDNWLKTIEDEELRKRIKDDYIVTGGAIASMLQGQNPNDFDVYFQTKEVALDVVNYYLKKIAKTEHEISARYVKDRIKIFIKSAGVIRGEQDDQSDYEYFEITGGDVSEYINKETLSEKKKYTIALITANAISLWGDIQIITRFIGDPAEIHKNFDFAHCTNYYSQKTGLVLNQDALVSILTKELQYVGSLYPLCSMFRIKKFLQRGWTITAGEMLKIGFDISKLDLTDYVTLEEQLVGVDYAYFRQVLEVLKKEDPQKLDRTYIFELINRIFDGDEVEELIPEGMTE